MLEIKGIKVNKKGKKVPIIEDLDLIIDKNGITIPNNINGQKRKKLSEIINNKNKYEIFITDAIFNNKSIKDIDLNNNQEKQEFLDNLKELDNSENELLQNDFIDFAMSKLGKNSNDYYNFMKKIDQNLRNDKLNEDFNNGLISNEMLSNNKLIENNKNEETQIIIDNNDSNFDVNNLKISCYKLNESGFTLVELLATMAILSIIMLMAVPNVIGVVQRNKNKTYVEDAKKLVSLAEYKVRSNANYKPISGARKCIYLSDVSASDLDEAPNGGTYDTFYSYVSVTNSNGKLTYQVQLQEKKDGQIAGGITVRSSSKLYSDELATLLTPGSWTCCGLVGMEIAGAGGSDEFGSEVVTGSSTGGDYGTSTCGSMSTPSTGGSGTSTCGSVSTPSTGGSGTSTCGSVSTPSTGGSGTSNCSVIVSPPATSGGTNTNSGYSGSCG